MACIPCCERVPTCGSRSRTMLCASVASGGTSAAYLLDTSACYMVTHPVTGSLDARHRAIKGWSICRRKPAEMAAPQSLSAEVHLLHRRRHIPAHPVHTKLEIDCAHCSGEAGVMLLAAPFVAAESEARPPHQPDVLASEFSHTQQLFMSCLISTASRLCWCPLNRFCSLEDGVTRSARAESLLPAGNRAYLPATSAT